MGGTPVALVGPLWPIVLQLVLPSVPNETVRATIGGALAACLPHASRYGAACVVHDDGRVECTAHLEADRCLGACRRTRATFDIDHLPALLGRSAVVVRVACEQAEREAARADRKQWESRGDADEDWWDDV
jgi:hypothetical protein